MVIPMLFERFDLYSCHCYEITRGVASKMDRSMKDVLAFSSLTLLREQMIPAKLMGTKGDKASLSLSFQLSSHLFCQSIEDFK